MTYNPIDHTHPVLERYAQDLDRLLPPSLDLLPGLLRDAQDALRQDMDGLRLRLDDIAATGYEAATDLLAEDIAAKARLTRPYFEQIKAIAQTTTRQE